MTRPASERRSLTETTPVVLPPVAPGSSPVPTLGRARPAPLRREGPDKLTGTALYTDDLVYPGAWYGATIRSTEPHARLLGIELDPDFDWSKVVVLTASRHPGREHRQLDQARPARPGSRGHPPPRRAGRARGRARPVAAPRGEAAHHALRTERLEPVFDPLASTQEFAAYEVGRGDVEAGFADASLVIEGEYRVGHQEQLYIENQAMIASPRSDGGVTVVGSLQCPYYVHAALKRALALRDDQAVVVQAETGGGFGGKEEYPSMIAIHAALLAQRVGRPVRMIYDRHEDIAATTKRHPAIVRHRSGVSADGRLVAQDVEVIMDGGAYCTLTPVVLSRGILHAGGPYECANVRIRGRAMATNTPPNGAFRGFGAPQTEFAAELQVARIADALGESPAALRERWLYRVGGVTPTGQVLRESVGSTEVLERAVEASEFERVRARTAAARTTGDDDGRWASGIGIAMAWHGAGFTGRGEVHLASVAGVELGDDGIVRVLAASTEIGQGTKTIFPMLVAEALGIEPGEVELAPVDTSVVPDSGPTVASRTAMVVGGLLMNAASRLRAIVEERSGGLFAETYRADAAANGGTRVDERFQPYPGIDFDETTYTGDAYPAFGWACAVAEVDVDVDTGEVRVRSVVSADDIGRVIHPVLAEGQVEGGTLQAVGYATIEEMKLEDGRYLNDRLATYLIPTAMDAPRITSILVEAPYSGAPHGAKGVGELPMDVVAPAIVDAIHDAVGVWITELPATPERVLGSMLETRAA